MLKMLEKLSIKEMNMKIDDIEIKVLELIECESQEEGERQSRDEDEDGDQIMQEEV